MSSCRRTRSLPDGRYGGARRTPLASLTRKTEVSYAIRVGYRWLPGKFAVLVNVEPHEVMQVLDGSGHRLPRRVTGPHGIPMVGILGLTTTGRGLVVYVRHDAGFDWTIVGARPMTPGESGEYEKWEAQQ
jgi:hypothetical protein